MYIEKTHESSEPENYQLYPRTEPQMCGLDRRGT